MLDKAVTITHTQTVTGFDPRTLLPLRQIQVTYTVDGHGPFQLVTPEANFTQQYLEQETAKTAATLRAVGAVTTPAQ